MTYRLIQRARGAYDLSLHDNVITSVGRNGSRQPSTWIAALLEDLPRSKRPWPFREVEHDFPSLEELYTRLGRPNVTANNRHSISREV